ncbi:hypothetical protein [Denitrificimonas caeni]|uniref:Pentapeptide repeat-containing protein n=1 Tax=Denitrificimonas caeni TaxID=521720 RepID=A0AAF0AJ43_9GAMM|nr:hypothetical protein [Denitrificimonas caeni]WBE25075.1 hypothetical protein O6P33_12055 [Denitrificimonas caeni]
MNDFTELIYDPSKPGAWGVTRHLQFYNYLKNHIAQQVKVYLPSLPIYVIEECLSDIFCSEENDDDLLENDDGYLEGELGIDSDLYRSVFEVRDVLEGQEVLLENITFPPQKTGNDPDYNKLFEPLTCLVFKDCSFYCNNISFYYPQNDIYFEGCSFHKHFYTDFNFSLVLEGALFKSCNFQQGITLKGIPFEGGAVFESCTISLLKIENTKLSVAVFGKAGYYSPSTADEVYIYNSTLEEDFILNLANLSKIQFVDSTFKGKANLTACCIEDLQVTDTVFEKTFDLSASVVQRVNYTGVEFESFALYERATFGNKNSLLNHDQFAEFERVSFHKTANFRDAVFYIPVDLRNTVFLQTPTFLGSIFKSEAKRQTDRETFRIIKQSFVAVSNQIEADRIYALEMEAYRSELKRNNGDLWDVFLLNFNACISNHGQSYIRASCWLFVCMSLIAFVLANDQLENQWIPTYISMPYWWLSMTQILNGFALGFLPFSKLYEDREHLALFIMLATFGLSGITWQLLVALRRHSRK